MTARSDPGSAPADPIDRAEERRRALTAAIPQSDATLASARDRFTARYCRALLTRASESRPEIAEPLLDRIAQAAATLGQTREVVEAPNQAEKALPLPPHQRLQELQHYLCRQPEPATEASRQRLAAALGFEAGTHAGSDHSELQSARRLRALQGRCRLDQVLDAAATQRPETPGPLNPQNLIARALAEMHAISPAYLARFISYSRQLLWLGKAAEKEKSR